VNCHDHDLPRRNNDPLIAHPPFVSMSDDAPRAVTRR
jgi:hypothetical protein